jgi:hypothetical protein
LCRHFSRAGLALDAAASGAGGLGRGGLLSVSPKLRADERRRQVRRASILMATCTTPSNPVAPINRAYGKTVWSWPSLLRSSFCSGPRVPAGTRPSLRPLGLRVERRSKARAKHVARMRRRDRSIVGWGEHLQNPSCSWCESVMGFASLYPSYGCWIASRALS